MSRLLLFATALLVGLSTVASAGPARVRDLAPELEGWIDDNNPVREVQVTASPWKRDIHIYRPPLPAGAAPEDLDPEAAAAAPPAASRLEQQRPAAKPFALLPEEAARLRTEAALQALLAADHTWPGYSPGESGPVSQPPPVIPAADPPGAAVAVSQPATALLLASGLLIMLRRRAHPA